MSLSSHIFGHDIGIALRCPNKDTLNNNITKKAVTHINMLSLHTGRTVLAIKLVPILSLQTAIRNVLQIQRLSNNSLMNLISLTSSDMPTYSDSLLDEVTHFCPVNLQEIDRPSK
jgi:hypothetical protein